MLTVLTPIHINNAMLRIEMSPNMTDEPADNDSVDLGEGFPQTIHDRARKAAEELHKLLVSLSTAALAVYFVALTSKVDPPLTYMQQGSVLCGLGFMALALGCGILAWYADMKRNFYWASAMQQRDKQSQGELYARRDRWLHTKTRAVVGLDVFFLAGILCSVTYIVMRVVEI